METDEAQNPPAAAQGATTTSSSSFKIPVFILTDLCSRFIINMPKEERQDLIRIFFQIELAHWFYLDFYCPENPEYKTCGIKDFSAQIFNHCPFLMPHADSFERILGDWKSYKLAVPTYGAIMLDPTLQYCILAQGYWQKSSWTFPKGKVNEDELPIDCAVREVLEETGYDILKQINSNDYIEHRVSDQLAGLYIIPNIPLNAKFKPKTRNEIKSLKWFKVDHLPVHKKDQTPKTELGLSANTFFMIIPFIKPLRKWIASRLRKTQHLSELSESQGPSKANRQRTQKETQDVKPLTEKQRLKQQQYFAQQNMSEYQDFMKFKDTKAKGRDDSKSKVKDDRSKTKDQRLSEKPSSHSPTPKFQKQMQTTSPKQKKQVTILNRDGSISGKSPDSSRITRRSLATQFTHPKTDGMQKSSQRKFKKGLLHFYSETWANFQLDKEALLKLMP
ncbi:m7GpppN-mRNA hydrolase [Lingula anatina]|uniref:m7GpppN-mRNA hydrolase n=1 Tax=Lingula anatina TaxID=7574 RepID=A0A1S3IZY7_LINAN|nr:m7GpppN-mRNA hydrolase [Lingula anatina]|eukprot:XP_013403114.1 m7GpppN-mRNA hydrolase [Lingula anatina]